MDHDNTPLKRKRRRRTLACEECRRRKVRCDREQPCANCVQAYKPEHCFYQPDPMVSKSPPMRAGHVRKLSEGPGGDDSERDRDFDDDYDRNRGRERGRDRDIKIDHSDDRRAYLPIGRTGSLESEWPASTAGTVTTAPSVAGNSTPGAGNRFNILPVPGGNGSSSTTSGGPPYHRHDDYLNRADTRDRFSSPASTSRGGPLPSFSTVSGDTEVSTLKEQVRRLENRLALVLNDQDEPHGPPPPPPMHHHMHHRGPPPHWPPPPHHHRPPHHRGPPPHHMPPHHYPPPYMHHFHPPPPPPPPPHMMHPHHHHELPFHDRHDRRDHRDDRRGSRHDFRHDSRDDPRDDPRDDRRDSRLDRRGSPQDRHDRHDSRHDYDPPRQALPPPQPAPPPPPPPPPPPQPTAPATLPLPVPTAPRFEGFGPDPLMHIDTTVAQDEDKAGIVSAKSRYISQGHWMNGALLTIMKPVFNEIMGKKESKNGNLYESMKKCKSLGRTIKARRAPTKLSIDFGKHIPAREVADELINSYFRTFETVYRVLHIPTFTRDYRRYWENPSEASSNFVIQMQLCMAIGTIFYDETCSLRHLASQWIYEAQIWLMSPAPSEKSRMNIPGLQTMCLLHLAREVSGIGADLVWISAGGLVRSAMYMGLHRDPTKIPKIPRYLAEIRRRLWATILEISLQSSIDSGGPPLISMTDFDTLPPANFFDDQLIEKPAPSSAANSTHPPPPKPLTTFTNTSIQIALLKSFPTRLAIARYVNDFRSDTSYDETLRLNSELRTATQALTGTIQSFRPSTSAFKLKPTTFQLRLVDHLTQRFYLSLNQSYLAASQNDPKFYFSRKVSVDTSLKLFQAWSGRASSTDATSTPTSGAAGLHTGNSGSASLSSSWNGGNGAPSVVGSRDSAMVIDTEEEIDDFYRLSISGSSGFRSVPVQCIATLSMDLLWQLEEEHSVRLKLGIKSLNGNSGHSSGETLNNSKFDDFRSKATHSEAGSGEGERGRTDLPGGSDGRGHSPLPPLQNQASSGSMLAMPGVVTQAVLLDALEQTVRYAEKRIRAGETNVKGYLFPCAVVAQARALARGATAEDMERTVLLECSEHLNHCVDLLREVAAQHATKEGEDAPTTFSHGSDQTMSNSDGDNNGMRDFLGGDGAEMDFSNGDFMPGSGNEWGWEDLMNNQGFNFSFNNNGMDSFFSGI